MKNAIAQMILVSSLAACQSGSAEREEEAAMQPAVLKSVSPEALAMLREQLAIALGRASLELGPGDLSTSGVISVLPARPSALEGHSPAMPQMFDLMLVDGKCVAHSRSDSGDVPLSGLECVAAD